MEKPPRLGRVQLRIMQVLWSRRVATAREITDELNRRTHSEAKSKGRATRDAHREVAHREVAPREVAPREIAHSTVQTLLRKLEEKGAVTHEVEGRTFRFRAVHGESEVAKSATRDLLSRVFHSSVPGLVAHLLKHEKISGDEMARLRQIIEEADQ